MTLLSVCDAPHSEWYRTALARCAELRRRGDCLSIGELAVGGRELMQTCGVQGRMVGRLLEQLLEQVLCRPELNKKETLLRLARTMLCHTEG